MTEVEQAPKPKYERQAKWRSRNPKAVWAHVSLKSALRRGLVKPEPCEVCGNPDSEGHHDDYDKPMAVRWFCRSHHKEEHRRLRAVNGEAS